MLTGLRRRLGELSLGENIPTIYQWRNMVEAGYLASYGIITEDLCALSADQTAGLPKGCGHRFALASGKLVKAGNHDSVVT